MDPQTSADLSVVRSAFYQEFRGRSRCKQAGWEDRRGGGRGAGRLHRPYEKYEDANSRVHQRSSTAANPEQAGMTCFSNSGLARLESIIAANIPR